MIKQTASINDKIKDLLNESDIISQDNIIDLVLTPNFDPECHILEIIENVDDDDAVPTLMMLIPGMDNLI